MNRAIATTEPILAVIEIKLHIASFCFATKIQVASRADETRMKAEENTAV